MLPEASDYGDLQRRFRWRIPEHYNIGVDVCDKWAARAPDREALIHLRADGGVERYSFKDISRLSNRLANALSAQGVTAGARVGVLLPQAPETAVAHVAVYKLGDSSVDFVVRPWAKTADYWNVYFDLTKAIKERFDREGISIPFPQTDVHLYQEKS